ncbi:Propionyl-CoA carboxylase alpha chain, mitochondrial [Zancudomyces culisetae]|uniref:Propionyl-CoA carboxylase alpha chain, mitochondrial n=1 Tax=Zancudomyces culisetae TaxID=1213189 RepID=A0A1R1PPW4_ZANCU|nr:Propionyl-CoA carboxylase alpha chain, mitochondrial [Zancudomyces culisetae]|eukprot:OMH83025.1 Propionyl-CoA carboxylase alpha chain, mitochondrial [Zancudomyces culisetae]
MDAIKQTGAQAVHPGYGFLSENAEFVKMLEANNVEFIGPNEKAMHAMGDKIQSKIIAKEAKVNVIPGFNGVVKDVNHAKQIANEIGYPVMLKASAGGGGKGMRIAWNEKDVEENFRLCTDEAKSSFGDSRLLVERFINNPRHIEIQIIADRKGNVLYLPERECSIQRRNQKVIEEAPSPHIDPATRKAMGEQAVSLARNVDYTSAGTVEFLVDDQRRFYFLEMNTRLQVEHPITEYITGMDLVEEMIRSAANLPLSTTKQEDVKLEGWAIESRVYAEDPENYLPSIGTLQSYVEPKQIAAENDVRCDSGITEGSEISMYYDPMICKLSTYGKSREEARQVMEKALDQYLITGVNHNIPLLRSVISHPSFKKGDLFTGFLAKYYPHGFRGHLLSIESGEAAEFAMISAALKTILATRDYYQYDSRGLSSLATLPATQNGHFTVSIPQIDGENQPFNLNAHVNISLEGSGAGEGGKMINFLGKNTFTGTVAFDNAETPADKKSHKITVDWSIGSSFVRVNANGNDYVVQYQGQLNTSYGLLLQYKGSKYNVSVLSNNQATLLKHMKPVAKVDTTNMVLAPMPGTIVSISVKPGDKVSEGMEIAVIEAMKMQNVLRAPRTGVIKVVNVKVAEAVNGEDVLVELEK